MGWGWIARAATKYYWKTVFLFTFLSIIIIIIINRGKTTIMSHIEFPLCYVTFYVWYVFVVYVFKTTNKYGTKLNVLSNKKSNSFINMKPKCSDWLKQFKKIKIRDNNNKIQKKL